ncbi:MAG: PTS sugar transporter subunit IIA [Alphaproteobacteria bacterium]|nr:PTS sugar transporter subunit IIA [Alphaproteobacteria bacterium]
MIGLVLVTHGRLAIELLAALEHVVGPQEQVAAVCIGPDDDMEDRRVEIARVARALNTGDGIVLLTDMFGGTPSNLAISVLGASNKGEVEVIAGVNLPMLVKLATCRQQKTLADAVADAEEAGRKYIQIASKLLAEAPG